MKNGLLLLLFLALHTHFLFAQLGEIFGRIVDAETQEPLSFANIELLVNDHLVSEQADLDGFYCLPSLPPNTYSVRILYADYTTQEVNGVSVSIDHATNLNIGLNVDEKIIGATECYFSETTAQAEVSITEMEVATIATPKMELIMISCGYHIIYVDYAQEVQNTITPSSIEAQNKSQFLAAAPTFTFFPNPTQAIVERAA